MALFDWDSAKYSVHVPAMDQEHQRIISLMNRLHDASKAGEPKAQVSAAFADLRNFTVQHFANEEAHMESIRFSDLRVHRGIHKSLLDRLTQFSLEFEKSDGRLSDEFFRFLKVWLSAHIQGVDRKYGPQ